MLSPKSISKLKLTLHLKHIFDSLHNWRSVNSVIIWREIIVAALKTVSTWPLSDRQPSSPGHYTALIHLWEKMGSGDQPRRSHQLFWVSFNQRSDRLKSLQTEKIRDKYSTCYVFLYLLFLRGWQAYVATIPPAYVDWRADMSNGVVVYRPAGLGIDSWALKKVYKFGLRLLTAILIISVTSWDE